MKVGEKVLRQVGYVKKNKPTFAPNTNKMIHKMMI